MILFGMSKSKNVGEKTYLLENAICASCKYALLCGGGCPAQNLQKHRCTHMEDIVHNAANKAYLSIK